MVGKGMKQCFGLLLFCELSEKGWCVASTDVTTLLYGTETMFCVILGDQA